MTIDNLKNAVPEYAKDLKLNLGSIARSTVLSEQQLWGTLLSVAAASKSATTLKEIAEDAADSLSAEAYNAAAAGNHTPVELLLELFRRPYDEQTEDEARYYRPAPLEARSQGGIGFMS